MFRLYRVLYMGATRIEPRLLLFRIACHNIASIVRVLFSNVTHKQARLLIEPSEPHADLDGEAVHDVAHSFKLRRRQQNDVLLSHIARALVLDSVTRRPSSAVLCFAICTTGIRQMGK